MLLANTCLQVTTPPRYKSMSNLVISYDLYKSGQNYEGVFEAIKSLGSWAKVHQSVWYVRSVKDVAAAFDVIRKHMDSNDSLIVVDAESNNAVWYGLTGEVSEHLKQQWNK
jgi:hypothetical protein